MIDDLKPIAIFAETVQQGSFRKAAQALGLSPSVVSYHISQLEHRTGAPLLYRSTRNLSMTSEGETLFRHATAMLTSAKEGLQQVSSDRISPSGLLKIAYPHVLSTSPVTHKIAQFAKRYPAVELDISCTDERQNIIEEGIDLAIRIGKMSDSSMKCREITRINRRLVCAPSYLRGRPLPTSVDALASWDWIKLSMMPGKRVLISPEGEPFVIRYNKHTTVNNVLMMTELCCAGLGLATPPDFLIDKAIAKGALIEILPQWRVDPIPVCGVWPENGGKSGNVRHLLDCFDMPDTL